MGSGTKNLHNRFKRNPRFRSFRDSDWQYLWAAYQMGAWEDMLSRGLERDDFRHEIISWLETVDREWILEADYEGKVRPMGLVLGWDYPGGRCIEPHMTWFPWATMRSQFECAAEYFRQVRKQYKVLVKASSENEKFFERLHKHQLLLRGCKIPDYFGPDETAMVYYTQGPFA